MKRVLIVLFAIVFLGLGVYAISSRMRSGTAAAKTQYKVAKVETGTVKKTVSATGTLKPWTVVDIKSKAGGRVDKLLVDAGTEVRKNQVLARIDPSDTLLTVNTARADIDAARAKEIQNNYSYQMQVRQSKIAIQNAKAALNSAIASRKAAQSRLQTAKSQATAQPKLTEAAIQQAEANYNNAVVMRNQLNATQPQARAQAQAAFDQAKANDENAKENLNRQQALLQKGFISQQAVDQAQANYKVTQAQVRTAQEKLNTIADEQKADVDAAKARVAQALAQLNNAKAQSIDIASRRNAVAEAQSAVAQADAQVEQAQASLNQAIANQTNNEIRKYDITSAKASIARAQATMDNAETTLDQTTVRAPSDGVILQKYVEEGTIITSGMSLSSTGTSILQLGDTTKMYVDVTVDETDIANVDPGQDVEVTVEAYPGIPFEGKVARVDPQAVVEQNVTTVHVRVEIDNSSPTFRLLKPGMNATCEFVIDEKEDAIAVPSEAVRTDDQGSFVEVAAGGVPAPADPKSDTPPDPDALVDVKVTRRPVEIGVEGNDTVEVVSGLKAGETIVTQTIEPETQTAGSPFGGNRGPFGGGGRGGGGGRR